MSSASKLHWGKFYWNDWRGDPRLKACGYAARGLWIDMLCIMAESDPTGYLTVGGQALEITTLARMTGGTESEANTLLNELERNGVFSRDSKGRIYSRRMVEDKKKSKIAQKNGKNGGNPTLGKAREIPASDNPQLKPEDKGGLKPQRPETRGISKDIPSADYRFAGKKIRLNDTDFDRLHALSGMSLEGWIRWLDNEDEWIACQPEEKSANWWHILNAKVKGLKR